MVNENKINSMTVGQVAVISTSASIVSALIDRIILHVGKLDNSIDMGELMIETSARINTLTTYVTKMGDMIISGEYLEMQNIMVSELISGIESLLSIMRGPLHNTLMANVNRLKYEKVNHPQNVVDVSMCEELLKEMKELLIFDYQNDNFGWDMESISRFIGKCRRINDIVDITVGCINRLSLD